LIAGNEARDAYGGGVVVSTRAGPIFNGVVIEANTAIRGGGGVYVRDTGTTCTFVSSLITMNRAKFNSNGGGLHVVGGADGYFNTTTFSYNIAAGYGGAAAISDRGSNPEFWDCIFTHNTAYGWYGGAVYMHLGAQPAFHATAFTRCQASFSGGGLYMEDAGTDPTFSRCSIQNNFITGWGQGDGTGRQVVLDDTSQQSCDPPGKTDQRANKTEGWNTSVPLTTYELCTVAVSTINGASGGGGGMTIASGSQARVSDTSITGNVAGAYGGGLVITDSNTNPTFTRCNISGNYAIGKGAGGGAAYLGGKVSPVFVECRVEGNVAGGYAGGFYQSDQSSGCSYPVYNRSTFRNNVGVTQSNTECECKLGELSFQCDVYKEKSFLQSHLTAILAIIAAIAVFGLFIAAVRNRYNHYYNWHIPLDSDGREVESASEFDDFGYGIIGYSKELKLKEELGSGNFGIVMKAILRRRDQKPARWCAVKRLEHGNQTEMIREARLMADIPPHLDLVRMLGICEEPACMVLEFVPEAEDLDKHLMLLRLDTVQNESSAALRKGGALYLHRAVQLMLDVARGADFLHSQGFVHRDLAARCAHSSSYIFLIHKSLYAPSYIDTGT